MYPVIKSVLIGATALLISACQSAPNPLIVQPAISANSSELPVALSVTDTRAQNYLLRIKLSDDQAQFASSAPMLETAIYDALAEKLNVVNSASKQVNVAIRQAIIRVEQGSVKHQAEHEISLLLTAQKDGATYTRDFNAKASSEGAFRADPAKLEEKFSELLGKLLDDMLRDPKLIDFMAE